jgi:hypothetical protein
VTIVVPLLSACSLNVLLAEAPQAENILESYEPGHRGQENAYDHYGITIGQEIGIHTQREAREQGHNLALLFAIDEIPSPYGAEED